MVTINNMTSALNIKRRFGLGNDNRKSSSFTEFWKGLGIIVGIWAVIYFSIRMTIGNIM